MELSEVQIVAARALADQRRMAVNLFRPLEHQEPIFEQPRPKWMLVDGGNRGGKTISLVALTSAFAMDAEITFNNGEKHPARMPWQRGRHVDIWVVCIDQDHIGRAIYPHFFKAGEFPRFRTIFDKKTKQLRPFIHGVDDESESFPHEPMIPASHIEQFAWDDYAKRIFKSVSIKDPKTGKPMATIRAFTSKGDPPQGNAVDLIFVDEQLARAGYITELQSRLLDKRGQLIWSSYCTDPGDDEDDLSKFSAMIDREVEAGSTNAKRVTLTMSSNTTMTKQQIAELLAGYATEEERLQRDLGIRPSNKLRLYPLFSKTIHCVDGYGDELDETLGRTDGIPPNTWTKTLILDPGTQHPCVLLCAVPPPELGNYYVPYMEIYPGRADPWQLAKIVADQTKGELFWKFIIDYRAGKQQTLGMRDGAKVKTQYESAWAEFGLSCSLTRNLFTWGSDDVGGRQLVLSGWLHNNDLGTPKLRIVTHRCPNLVQQMTKIKKKVANKEVLEDRKAAGHDHDAVDCYDSETEVLTSNRGWQLFSNLTSEDSLATVNMESKKIEFQKPTRMIARWHSGEMVRIKSRRLDMLVTPNHRMVVVSREGEWKFKRASDLKKHETIPLGLPGGFDGTKPKIVLPRQFRGHKQIDEIKDVAATRESHLNTITPTFQKASLETHHAGRSVPKFHSVPYSGMVYCASVPNTTLVVRRNGRVAACGNCLEYFAASGPKYVQVKKPKSEDPECFKRYMSKFGSSDDKKPIQVGTFY
jgi:hypothetical protein